MNVKIARRFIKRNMSKMITKPSPSRQRRFAKAITIVNEACIQEKTDEPHSCRGINMSALQSVMLNAQYAAENCFTGTVASSN